jgi:hypothetical protein
MIKESDYEAKYRTKTISGMTSILLPKILSDFPNFNELEFYNKVETSIIGILNSITNKKVSDIKELAEIRNNLNMIIESNNNNKIEEEYKDIIFHQHAIKSYKNSSGILEIEVNSSLEYYYIKKVNGIVKINNDYKKQTTFTTTFVYIYDPDEYNINYSTLGIHCSNCSAPITNINTRICEYCNSKVDDINLRSWYITKYKDNF